MEKVSLECQYEHESYVAGLTCALGVDFHIRDPSGVNDWFMITIFGEGASPVAYF